MFYRKQQYLKTTFSRMQRHRHDERRPQNPHRGGHFTPCGWCHACEGTNCTHTNKNNTEDPEGTEICTDKKVNQLFNQTGCLSCQSKNGMVKMFPDKHGTRLLGRQCH